MNINELKLEVGNKKTKANEVYARLIELIDLFEKNNLNFDVTLSYTEHIIFRVTSLNRLRELRKYLRGILSGWNDEINQIWSVLDRTGNISYRSKDHLIEIWLSMSVDEINKYLQTSKKYKNCSFKERFTKDTAFVCEVSK